jgi:hypothetical protein
VTGPVNLDLSTGSGSVNVRAGSSSEVQVTGHIRVTNWFGGDADERIKRIEADPPIQQNGNDVRIGHIGETQLLRNISISYDLVVPAETQLRSHTGSGSQSVEGIRRQVEVESGSGSLKIADIDDTVRAETGSGEIAIDRRRVRYAPIPAPVAWNCEACMARSRLKQAAARSPPMGIVDGAFRVRHYTS